MRVHLSLIALLSVSLAGVTRADDWQPEPGFRSLFSGKDLTGWCFRTKGGDVTEKFEGKIESSDAGRYSALDGILTVNFPKGRESLISALYTVEEFPKDFTLKLEFRASPCLASIRFPGRRSLFSPDASAGRYSLAVGVGRPFLACSTR